MASVIELVLRARADEASLREATGAIREAVEANIRSSAQAAAESVRAPIRNLLTQFEGLGRQLATTVTAPLTLIGGAASHAVLQWDRTFTKIVNLTGVAAGEVDRLRQAVLGLSGETARKPQELAEALYFLLSSGLRAEEALQALRASAQAAAVGLGETQTVADAVSTVMNAYGAATISAEQATAVLLAAVREGKAESDALAGAIGRVVPVAATMGVSFHEVAAALAAMTQVGLSAEEAVTALRAILVDILQPSQQAEEALRQYGLSADQLRAILREQGLLALLETLRTAFAGNERQLVQVVDNVRGLVGVLNLLGRDAEQVRGTFQRLASTTENELAKAFQQVQKSVSFQFAQAMAELARAAIQLGETISPGIVALAGAIRALASAARLVPEPIRATVVLLGALAAAAGPVLYVLAQLAKLAGSLRTAWQALAAVLAMPGLRAAWGLLQSVLSGVASFLPRIASAVLRLAGPIGLVTGSVLTLAQAWSANWFGIRQVTERHVPALAAMINALARLAARAAESVARLFGARPREGAPEARPAQTPQRVAELAQQEFSARRQLQEETLRLYQDVQAKILELEGRTLAAKLQLIDRERQEILAKTGDVVLAERYAHAARLEAERQFSQQRMALVLDLYRQMAAAAQQSGLAELTELAARLEERKRSLDQALQAELLSWQEYSNQVVTLERTAQLSLLQSFAQVLASRRAELEQFRRDYEAATLQLLDVDARIATLRAQIAGERASEVLRAEQGALERVVYSEQLSAETRAQIARRLQSVIEQRIRALAQERDTSWAVAQAQEDLNRARSAELQALMMVRQERAQQLPMLRELLQLAQAGAERIQRAWLQLIEGLRSGAVSLRDLVLQALAGEAPRAFVAAWQAAAAQVRQELMLIRQEMEKLDPRARRSPSVVDLVRAGMGELEREVERSARRIGESIQAVRAGADLSSRRGPGAGGAALVINGQQITLHGRQAADLVSVLVRDPIQRMQLLRAMALA